MTDESKDMPMTSMTPGTVARLRSGGPDVTVCGTGVGHEYMDVAWFDGTAFKTAMVPAAALVAVEDEEARRQEAMATEELLRQASSVIVDVMGAIAKSYFSDELTERLYAVRMKLTERLYG
jgi:uncharacterized protein YodC (DUF2158 family)